MTLARAFGNAGAIAALTLVALVPLSAAYADADFWVTAVGGTLLGSALAVLGWRLTWHPLTVAAATAAAYFVFGGALVFRSISLVGFVPTIDVLASLAAGAVQSWKQVLTLQTPFTGFEQLGIVPYVASMVVSVVGVSLALRLSRTYGWALVAPGGLLVLSVAFSTYQGRFPGVVGALWVGGALVWVLWRAALRRSDAARGDSDETVTRRRSAGRIAPVAGIVVVALLVGAGAASAASAGNREVLRDHIIPPLDLRDYASPLTMYRKYERDGSDVTLFTVQGLPAGVPIRLATLDLYDGVVYKVSGSGGAGSGVFSRVGREIGSPVSGEPISLTIDVDQLSGVWLPTVGYASGVRFEGDDAATLSGALHYNSATGTAIVTSGLATGDVYELEVVVPPTPSEDELADAAIAPITTPAPLIVPDEVTSLIEKVTAGATTPVEQVRAIEAYFQTTGFYSSGLEGQAISRSGHTIDRESELLGGTQMVGDDEQYAVAMALMVSQLGIPVRVVMGFATDTVSDTVAVTGDQLAAWVEVPFEGLGWVAFDPTPSEDRIPQEETPQQSQKPQAQVAQPPQTPQEPAELPPTSPLEESEQTENPVDLGWLWASLRITGSALLLLAIVLGPSVALGIARATRRRRRRGAATSVDQVDGGWAEFIDAATDVGAPLTPGATRREQARSIDEVYPRVAVAELAVRADAAVFGTEEPAPGDVERFWQVVDEATSTLRSSVPWHRRLFARAFPGSVVRRIRVPRWRRGSRRAGEDQA